MRKFEDIQMAAPDPIFGLAAAFQEDPRSDKVNLGVGVYRTADLKPPLLSCVKRADEMLVGKPRPYLPIDGDKGYVEALKQLAFGGMESGQIYGAQTPAGTAALRVAGDLLNQELGLEAIYVPSPTWANHRNIFSAAGLQVETYSYYDRSHHMLMFEEMLADLKECPAGSCVLLHACCHNPTGVDPTLEQWGRIADLIEDRHLLPLIDCAYQGMGAGIEEDAAAIRMFVGRGIPLVVTYSCSKNFGLYAERTGALFVLTPHADAAERVGSQVKRIVRANYSNPPCHGAWIVRTILESEELTEQWKGEVAAMRARIHEMRQGLMAGLLAKGGDRDFSFLEKQKGFFSFCGLSRDQVERLKSEYGIYMPSSGRVNVTGLNSKNLDYVVEAICSVL